MPKVRRIISIPQEIDEGLIKLKGYDGFSSINEIYIGAAKALLKEKKELIARIRLKSSDLDKEQ